MYWPRGHLYGPCSHFFLKDTSVLVWANPSSLRSRHCRPPPGDQRPRVNSSRPASEKEVINDPGQIPGSQAGAVGFEGRWPLLSAHTPQWLHLARQELVSRSSLCLPADLLALLCSPLLPPPLPSPAEQCWGVCPHPPLWLLSWATALRPLGYLRAGLTDVPPDWMCGCQEWLGNHVFQVLGAS